MVGPQHIVMRARKQSLPPDLRTFRRLLDTDVRSDSLQEYNIKVKIKGLQVNENGKTENDLHIAK